MEDTVRIAEWNAAQNTACEGESSKQPVENNDKGNGLETIDRIEVSQKLKLRPFLTHDSKLK